MHNKLIYRWSKVHDIYYVKVYSDRDYLGVLTFPDEASMCLFMDTAMCGRQGLKTDAPVHVNYYLFDNTPCIGKVEVHIEEPRKPRSDE